MVGVLGRSKGCNTCRQRRVKCSEEKPICSRCTKGGFKCLGYARETVWHHLTVEPSPTESSSQAATLGRLVLINNQPPADATTSTNDISIRSKESIVCTQLNLTAFQDDLCFSYIFSNFVWRGYGASWLHQSAQGLLGQLAFDSVKALAEINFGRSQKSSETEIQGRLKYGRALRHMVDRLGKGQKNNLRELVVPILLLLMHTTTLTNHSAAMFHLQAMTQIMTTCGPTIFQHQPLRDAFEAARATMVVASLVTRKRTPIDSPIWHTGPYELVPSSKPSQSYLMDILVSVPGLLEEHGKLERMMHTGSSPLTTSDDASSYSSGSHSSENDPLDTAYASFEDIVAVRSDIIDRTVAKLESLFAWRLHWQVTFGSQVSTTRSPSTSPSGSAASNNQNAGKLSFARSGAAADIALYNAVLMWLLALIKELDPLRLQVIVQSCAYKAMTSMTGAEFSFASGQQATRMTELPSFGPLKGVGSIITVRDAAIEICRIFEWQSGNHEATTWEANIVYMFPIGLALCVFDTEPEVRDWIRSMLNTNALTRDYGACPAMGGANVHHANNPFHDPSSLAEHGAAGAKGSPEPETGILYRLQEFARYVTRELADDEEGGETPHPSSVHLLLLRGRTDIAT